MERQKFWSDKLHNIGTKGGKEVNYTKATAKQAMATRQNQLRITMKYIMSKQARRLQRPKPRMQSGSSNSGGSHSRVDSLKNRGSESMPFKMT